MVHVLNKRERDALAALARETSYEEGDFIYRGKLPSGTGVKTLEKLVELGLAEKGPSKRYWGDIGYRTTENAAAFLHGATQPIAEKKRRSLPTLPPRLTTLKPHLTAKGKPKTD